MPTLLYTLNTYNSSSRRSPYRIQCNSSSNRSPYRIQCNSSSNRSPYRIQCNNSSNRSPYRIQCNNSSNRSPYRIQCNSSSNRSPYRIQLIVALTGLPITNSSLGTGGMGGIDVGGGPETTEGVSSGCLVSSFLIGSAAVVSTEDDGGSLVETGGASTLSREYDNM